MLIPTEIEGMEEIYIKYPGPFAIVENDLNKIFPGINKIKTKEYGTWVQGNLLRHNIQFINKLVSYLTPETIVEIGTFKGVTTLNMALNSIKSKIITIDSPLGGNFFSGSDIRYFQSKNDIGSCFKNSVAKKRIIQIFDDSTSGSCQKKLDEKLKNKKIDFAFIDGGHTYENIKHDFEELILPRLKEGGVVVFDDYNRLYTVIGATHYLAQKAREDHYVFYWYAPKKSENTNEVIFINSFEARNYDWEKA